MHVFYRPGDTLFIHIDHTGTVFPEPSPSSTKVFMLFHHKPVPSSRGLNAGGDGKRGRKGRLVEEWRNIISMRSRRGFELCRLPSAPSTFLLSFFPEDLETLSCQ